MPLNSDEMKGQEQTAFLDNPDVYKKPTEARPIPEAQIGVDTNSTLFQNIINAGEVGKLDISAIESFSQVSQSRDQIYALLDTMCEDSTVSAILETYAEDATEYNESGQIVWAESSDAEIAKYVSFLLDSMCVDKNIYKWVHSLCKYGDIYLRLYRESDYKDDLLFKKESKDSNERATLNEDINVKVYSKNDHYVHYLEMVPNPAEVFELTKFGKTYAYVKASVKIPSDQNRNIYQGSLFQPYKFNKNDIDIYNATDFVHACLEDNSTRTPEQVQIFMDDESYKNEEGALTYTVKRGQSLLYNTFKIWRELALLENSILLNRITKSAIIRVIGVEVGDMPKEMVGPHLQGIKQLIEQKAALDTGKSLNEYTNPGPIENNIYVPTHGGVGALTTQQIGGDVNIGQLSDLDYFQDKFFGSMRVPKQYFGITDDNAGFSGGQSLSIISSRYAKMVKRIQATVTQALTDAINLMLIDKGMDTYVNKFTIKMLPPTTQEEIDRRENLSGKVQLTSDIMNMLTDIEDPVKKLEVLKALLSDFITNTEVIDIIQQEIEKLEEEVAEGTAPIEGEEEQEDIEMSGSSFAGDLGLAPIEGEEAIEGEEEVGEEDSEPLPSPEELGAGDFSDNNNPEI